MEILKAGLVIAAALGSTWVAREATESVLGVTQAQALVQAAEPRQPPGGATTPPAAPQSSSPAVPQISEKEIEEELRRAKAEISGKPAGDMDEFRPTKPLSADIAIALPSDM
jgi:hypothetical protein